MKKIIRKFYYSYTEMKNVRSLVALSLLVALQLVLSFFRIDILPTLRLSFAFVAIFLMGTMYGPVAAGLGAGMGDIIGYIIKPTGPYFFGFTFNAILGGVIVGLFMYRSKLSLWRVIGARACITVFVNLVLNTWWLSIIGGKAFMALLIPRVAKNFIMLPIEIIVVWCLLKALDGKLRTSHI